jgi:pimeloyl-ACP methyl ester carboxylesterase
MRFFLDKGYRVIAHDRRRHGRSDQQAFGYLLRQTLSDAFVEAKKYCHRVQLMCIPALAVASYSDKRRNSEASLERSHTSEK